MLARLARALERLLIGENGGALVCSARSFTLAVRCADCGEVIEVRVDRDHDLQSVYPPDAEEGDHPSEYVLRKEVVGESCQNLIHFTIRFDRDYGPVGSEIEGGEFVASELARERGALDKRAELTT